MVYVEYRHGDVIIPRFNWGIVLALRDAEGSTGQTSSSDNWDEISETLRRLASEREAERLVATSLLAPQHPC